MIIHPPEITTEGDEISISARIEYEQTVPDIPDRLWFRYPLSCADYLEKRCDVFAAGLVLVAMHLGEDMELRGSISPKLLYGLQEYQRIFHRWLPRELYLIDIQYNELVPFENRHKKKGVGLAFSGGIDSHYTLWANLPENQPLRDYQVTHCFFQHGFDISLLHDDDFESARDSFSAALKPLGIKLVTCRTNLHAFSEGRIPWFFAHGPALLAPSLGINALFRIFYVAASSHYNDFRAIGSSPLTDHLLSTETLQFVHHGTSLTKPQKLEAIRDWPTVQRNLRVCTDQEQRLGVQNCSRCFKCTRTRINLKLLDSLDDFVTFNRRLTFWEKARWVLKNDVVGPWAMEIIQLAVEKRKWHYLPWFYAAIPISWVKLGIRKCMPRWLFEWLKEQLYPPHKNPFLYSTIVRHKSSLK
ncbi:MAG: hypothetical protein MUO76_21875 [Anaerolineaceae bacterium]|nr:hypothetical protein [Anaerolineaceae bacterium]